MVSGKMKITLYKRVLKLDLLYGVKIWNEDANNEAEDCGDDLLKGKHKVKNERVKG